MAAQQVFFLVILTIALGVFVSGRVRVDITALLVALALVFAGILTPVQALSGFSSEPAIIVASVFVLSAGLSATGVTDKIGALIGHAAGAREWRALVVLIPSVALLAAFSHHLMVTAMMLPIVMRMARDQSLSASRLLMPMSLAASLGTTLTLFSAPAFLLAGHLLEQQTGHGLGVFAITPIGIGLVILGLIYVLLMRWLIPKRSGTLADSDYLQLDKYYTELIVEPDSTWSGKTLDRFSQAFNKRLQLVDWMRDGARVIDQTQPMQSGDVLLVRASPDEISSIKDEPGLALHAVAKYGDSIGTERLVQVIVGPGSEFAGRSVGDIDFLKTLGVLVVGLWRRDDWMSEKLSQVRLREGDLLVLWGDPERFAEVAQHRGFLMMVAFSAQHLARHRAPLALGIMALVVATAATGWASTPIVFLAGAVAMVMTRCVTIERAYAEIDVRIFVMIAGVIPLGAAMEKTGTAELLAQQLLVVSSGWSALAMLGLVFAAAALLTQVLSDAATVVLLGPVAIAIAVALGLPPAPFVVCTAIGAVASFLTPIGHHGNLLILGPGQYTFGDFLRVGLPLTLCIGALSAWLAQALWLGGPWLPSR